MARQKTKKKVSRKPLAKKTSQNRLNSLVNIIYAGVTLVVICLLVFFTVKTFTQDNGEITQESASVSEEVLPEGSRYVVKKGDTVWSIAESETGSGFNWKEIVTVNNIKDPANLEIGTKLSIPKILQKGEIIAQASPVQGTTKAPSVTQAPTTDATISPVITRGPTQVAQPALPTDQSKITGSEYTIVKGDTLWDISVRAYGNGYRWTEIAKMNNLSNPDLIFSGNQLKLPK